VRVSMEELTAVMDKLMAGGWTAVHAEHGVSKE
jgi:hypothetical protein